MRAEKKNREGVGGGGKAKELRRLLSMPKKPQPLSYKAIGVFLVAW